MADLETVDDVIAHYGVKGMRWGVRRKSGGGGSSSGDSDGSSGTKVTLEVGKKGLSAKGGDGVRISDDALMAAVIKQVATQSGPSSLSNNDMQTLVNRMNLEKNYANALASSAPAKKVSLGGKIADALKSQAEKTVMDIAKGALDQKIKGVATAKGIQFEKPKKQK